MYRLVKKQGTRPRGRPRAFDPGHALDRAAEVFWEKGYDAASLDDLTRAMGINRPSLYAAFGNKQELYRRCLDRYGETSLASLRVALELPDIADAIRQFLLGTAKATAEDGRPRGCLIACTLPTAAGASAPLRSLLALAIAEMEAAVAARLARAVAMGQLPPDFPVEVQAAMAADFVLASALRARAGASCDSLARHAEAAARTVLR